MTLIDKKCGDKPECFGPLDGAGWVNLVEGNVDGGTIYCGSPSGAFADSDSGTRFSHTAS